VLAKAGVKTPLTARRFSALESEEEGRPCADPPDHQRRMAAGMDLAKEIEIVDGLALATRSCSSAAATSSAFAICHSPGVSEGRGRRPCT